MNIDFSGKTVIVTGAAHGFGRAIAQGFSARGANVHICDVNEAGLLETVKLCGDKAKRELGYQPRFSVEEGMLALSKSLSHRS